MGGVMGAVSACAVVSVVAEEDLAGGEEDTVAPVLLRSQLRLTPSPTTPPMEVNGVRSSSFETFHGPPATKIWSNCSPLLARSNVQRSSTRRTDDPRELEWFSSTAQKMLRLPSQSSPATCTAVVPSD